MINRYKNYRKAQNNKQRMKMFSKLIPLTLLILQITVQSCRKLVDVPPPINSITNEMVYGTDMSAASILTGIYVSMGKPEMGGFMGIEGFSVATALSADELFLSTEGGSAQAIFFRNELINGVGIGGGSWPRMYNYVYRCNAAIEGLAASKTISPLTKQQLLGEAYFVRALCYFQLVNLFGPVPLALNTNYKQNTLLARSPVKDVYKVIIDDLKRAQELLSDQFLNALVNAPTIERTRPSKWAAGALLARTYLYVGDYAGAAEQATLVINNTGLFGLVSLNHVFLKNSREAIWQLQPTAAFWNTEDAKLFIIPSTGFTNVTPFYLNPSLVNSFEPGDQRRTIGNWIGEVLLNGIAFYYPYKYKISENNPDINPDNGTQFMTEYPMVFRLGELYLTRAEARAQLNDLSGAIADLDSIRYRAGLPLISVTDPAVSKQALVESILRERRVELFGEGCHRWFDLKRTGTVDAVMSVETPLKGGIWNNRESLYPIPLDELQRAPNLKQNPGYPDI